MLVGRDEVESDRLVENGEANVGGGEAVRLAVELDGRLRLD